MTDPECGAGERRAQVPRRGRARNQQDGFSFCWSGLPIIHVTLADAWPAVPYGRVSLASATTEARVRVRRDVGAPRGWPGLC